MALTADWFGYQITSSSRDAKAAINRRDKRDKYRLKDLWIEFSILTLPSNEIRMHYQMMSGHLTLVITIFGASQTWVAHGYLEKLSRETRNRIVEKLGDPRAFLAS